MIMTGKAVHIQPIGHVNTRLIGRVSLKIGEQLHSQVEMLPGMTIPGESFNPQRRQYSSPALLETLAAKADGSTGGAGKIIGVIDEDLFSPIFTFVFGEAQKDQAAAIVSMKRLRQEFYGLPRDWRLLELRIFKEMVHEIGHLFGLTHCGNENCVMFRSTNVRSLDKKGSGFCGECGGRLRQRV